MARDGTNWYSYCANNPVNKIDPSGLMMTDGGGGGYVSKSSSKTSKISAIDKYILMKNPLLAPQLPTPPFANSTTTTSTVTYTTPQYQTLSKSWVLN